MIGVLRKIHARDQLDQQSAHEHGDEKVWRLRYAVRPGHATRLDGGETKRAIRAGGHAPETPESRCDCFAARILWMGVNTLRISLPDLQHRIVHRFAFAIEHPALNGDFAARR